ncbi:MAG: cytochrome c [Chloroflexaceae bacterium]|nr:cytochrome c [Chloroflexaceae bacterium]
MKTFLKWLGIVAGVLVVLVLIAVGSVYMMSEQRTSQTYTIEVQPVAIPTDAEAIAWGEHLSVIRGCNGCHAANFAGETMIDDPVFARFHAPNLTTGAGGIGAAYTDIDWVRAIRHGVGPAGKPLLVMPAHEYYNLSEYDMGALIAYMKTVPPVDNPSPASSLGPIGRILSLDPANFIVPATAIDHTVPPAEAPEPGATVEYGRYLAPTCTGCHASNFAGGRYPGAGPEVIPAKNLTPDPITGMGNWTLEDFKRVLREGIGPDGLPVGEEMPRTFAAFSDEEIEALWLYLQSLEPLPQGE